MQCKTVSPSVITQVHQWHYQCLEDIAKDRSISIMDLVPPCFDKHDSKFIFHYDPAGLQQAITEAVAADKMKCKSQEEARADDADFDMSAPAA